MRLSEIQGERVFDVIADILEPMLNISEDPDVKALLNKDTLPDGADAREEAAKKLKRHLPQLLRRHKQDFIAILAALDGVPVEEYRGKLTFPKLIKDATTMLTDSELLGFFGLAQTATEQQ